MSRHKLSAEHRTLSKQRYNEEFYLWVEWHYKQDHSVTDMLPDLRKKFPQYVLNEHKLRNYLSSSQSKWHKKRREKLDKAKHQHQMDLIKSMSDQLEQQVTETLQVDAEVSKSLIEKIKKIKERIDDNPLETEDDQKALNKDLSLLSRLCGMNEKASGLDIVREVTVYLKKVEGKKKIDDGDEGNSERDVTEDIKVIDAEESGPSEETKVID